MGIGTALAIAGGAIAALLANAGSLIGMRMTGQAAAGVITEDPSKANKIFILQLLPSTQGLYGLLTAFLLYLRLNLMFTSEPILALTVGEGIAIFAACLPVAIVCLISGVQQAKVAVAGIGMVAKNGELSARALIMAGSLELFQIFALLISLFGTTFSQILQK